MNSYTLVDENNWRRREHCALFRHYVEPSYCMTVDLDITNFLRTIREEGYSFTMSFIWVVSKCANEIEEFSTGSTHTSHTWTRATTCSRW